MLVGAAEDVAKQQDPDFAKLEMDKARLAGPRLDPAHADLDDGPDDPRPERRDRSSTNAISAAQFTGLRVVLSLYPFGSSVTPLTDQDRADFAAFARRRRDALPAGARLHHRQRAQPEPLLAAAVRADGSDAAAPAYLQLLATTYDALKAARPHSTLYGGALAPRGVDKPDTGRDTHSPTAFIADLGAAYRASGRQVPVMDAFAFHPYPETSATGPALAHPNGTSIGLADYPKLVSLLGAAFDGTAQRGQALPILYDEFGIETQVPPAKASLYSGTEPATTKPVDEATQAQMLTPGDADDVLPADRARPDALPRRRTSPYSAPGSRASSTSTARRRLARPRCAPPPAPCTAASRQRAPGMRLTPEGGDLRGRCWTGRA